MMQRLTDWALALGVMMLGFGFAAAIPSNVANAAPGAGCQSTFLTFPAWYDGLLAKDGSCKVELPSGDAADSIGGFVWRIVLNLIEIGLQIVAYVSAGFIIYGGFRYLTSSGSPDKTTAARKTIMNAVVGLVLSFFSVVIVSFVANGIG